MRAAISFALGRPYEGDVDSSRVGMVARMMRAIGVDYVGVGLDR